MVGKDGPKVEQKTYQTNTRVVVRFRPINKIEKRAWKADQFTKCIKEAQLEKIAYKFKHQKDMADPRNWPKYASEKWDAWLKDTFDMQPGHIRLFKRFCKEFDFAKLDEENVSDVVPVEVYEDMKQIQVYVPNEGETKSYAFDEVMWWQRDQRHCFVHFAQPVIAEALKGFNATLFAYGQSGSGKTYTLFGPEPLDKAPPEHLGIIPTSVAYLFKCLQGDATVKTFEVKTSFLEVYLERLRDLIQPKDANGNEKKLKIIEMAGGKAALDALRSRAAKAVEQNNKGGRSRARLGRMRSKSKAVKPKEQPIEVIIDNLSEQRVETVTQVQSLIAQAAHHRTKERTNLNASSSRSHLIMTVRLTITMKAGTVIRSKINFADLAGSEKVGKTSVTGKHLKEAAAINQSLTALRTVIDALVKQKSFVSFRDSKLTRALRDSLGGNTKTTLVLACSPHKWNLEETLETLKFGARAKFIRSKVIVNAQASVPQLEAEIKKLKKENDRLRKMLQIENAKQGIRALELQNDPDAVAEDGDHASPLLKRQGSLSPRARASVVSLSTKLAAAQSPGRTHRKSLVASMLEHQNSSKQGINLMTRSQTMAESGKKEMFDVAKTKKARHSRMASDAAVAILQANDTQANLQLELSLREAKDELKEMEEQLEEANRREQGLTQIVEELVERVDLLEHDKAKQEDYDIQRKEFIEETTSALDGQLQGMTAALEEKEKQLAEALLELAQYKRLTITSPGGDAQVNAKLQAEADEMNKRIDSLMPRIDRNQSMRLSDDEKEESEDASIPKSGTERGKLKKPNKRGRSLSVLTGEVANQIAKEAKKGIPSGGIEAVLMVLENVAKLENKDIVITLNQLIDFFRSGNLTAQTCMRVFMYLPEGKLTVNDIREVVEATKLSLRLRDRAICFADYLIKVADDFAALIQDLPPVEDVLDGDGASFITMDDIMKIELGEVHTLIFQEAFQFLQADDQENVLLIDFQIFIDHLTGRGEILGLSDDPIDNEDDAVQLPNYRSQLMDPVKKIFLKNSKKGRDKKAHVSKDGCKSIINLIREDDKEVDKDDAALHILQELSLANLEAVILKCPEPMWHTLIEGV